MSTKWVGRFLIIGIIVAATMGLANAHDTQTVNGYELTFGGADEPVITGERMWLEVRIVDADTQEPVEDAEETLAMAVQRPFGNDTYELAVSSRFGAPGWYEAAVIFTQPGTYTVYLNGTIEGTAIDTTFQTQVHNASDLQYPNPTATPTTGSGLDTASGFGLGALVAAVGMALAYIIGRRTG